MIELRPHKDLIENFRNNLCESNCPDISKEEVLLLDMFCDFLSQNKILKETAR